MFSKVQMTITNVSWLLGLYDQVGRKILLLRTESGGMDSELENNDSYLI